MRARTHISRPAAWRQLQLLTLLVPILALAAWSLFDLTVSALLTGPILYWSDLAFTLLCAIQCGVSAAWFWSRFRTLPRPANASLNSGLQQRAHGPLGRSEVR